MGAVGWEMLSFSLELEINGRWPWQQAGGGPSGSRPGLAGPAT